MALQPPQSLARYNRERFLLKKSRAKTVGAQSRTTPRVAFNRRGFNLDTRASDYVIRAIIGRFGSFVPSLFQDSREDPPRASLLCPPTGLLNSDPLRRARLHRESVYTGCKSLRGFCSPIDRLIEDRPSGERMFMQRDRQQCRASRLYRRIRALGAHERVVLRAGTLDRPREKTERMDVRE